MSRLSELAKLDSWLENREPLIVDFKSMVFACHQETRPFLRSSGDDAIDPPGYGGGTRRQLII